MQQHWWSSFWLNLFYLKDKGKWWPPWCRVIGCPWFKCPLRPYRFPSLYVGHPRRCHRRIVLSSQTWLGRRSVIWCLLCLPGLCLRKWWCAVYYYVISASGWGRYLVYFDRFLLDCRAVFPKVYDKNCTFSLRILVFSTLKQIYWIIVLSFSFFFQSFVAACIVDCRCSINIIYHYHLSTIVVF